MNKIKSILGVFTPTLLRHITFLGLIVGSVLMIGAVNGHEHAKSHTSSRSAIKPVDTLFSPVATLDELQQRLARAKLERKPVMIEFYASWCSSCRALDALVFSTLQIQQLMHPFTTIRVDLTEKDEGLMQIAMYYQVYGTPTFIFYDKNGDEFNTDRFRNSEELKAVLKKLAK